MTSPSSGVRARILAFSGSTRRDSFNTKLINHAAECVRSAGGEVTVIHLAEFNLPLYDGDLEAREGLPEGAKKLKSIMKSHHGLLIASPEYNSSITAVLKNAIDWASRSEPGERALEAFAGKVAALMAASPGALGGLRGLVHLRAILGNIKVIVLPDQIAIGQADKAFDDQGRLKDDKQRASVDAVCSALVNVTRRMIS